jgi:large subunit ribosomal protein L30
MKVKLVKSLIGRSPKQMAAAKALGLKKIGDTAEVADTPVQQGQLNRIKFMLEVQP